MRLALALAEPLIEATPLLSSGGARHAGRYRVTVELKAPALGLIVS